MSRSRKIQLISDRPTGRLVSAGHASPGPSEDDLVQFLQSYSRLHTDDICAQRVDPSDLVAWVFMNGAWQVRQGLDTQKDAKSWCRVYLTSMLGLDPVQYERAKRELFTSNDGLTGVYRHKTRPAHALVYRPSRSLSTASIAAITAGSAAAAAGVGSLAWRQYFKHRNQTAKVPTTTLDQNSKLVAASNPTESEVRIQEDLSQPPGRITREDFDDLQKFQEHVDKLTQSASNLTRHLTINEAQVADNSNEFIEFTRLLADAKPFEDKVRKTSSSMLASEMKSFRDLATKTQALINAQTSRPLIEQMFDRSYSDVVKSNLWKNHQADLSQYIGLADNSDLNNALLATQLYESIVKAPKDTWVSSSSLSEVFDRLERESDCADIKKCPFRKLIQELRDADSSNSAILGQFDSTLDKIEESTQDLKALLRQKQNDVITESDFARFKELSAMFDRGIRKQSNDAKALERLKDFKDLLDETSALSETNMAQSEIDALLSKTYDDILKDDTWQSPAFQNYIKLTRNQYIQDASLATKLFKSISEMLSDEGGGWRPESELDQLRTQARKELDCDSGSCPFKRALEELRAKFPGRDALLWIDAFIVRKDIENAEHEIQSALRQGSPSFNGLGEVIGERDKWLAELEGYLRDIYKGPDAEELINKVGSLRQLVGRIIALKSLGQSEETALTLIKLYNNNPYHTSANPQLIQFAKTIEPRFSTDVDQFLARLAH